MLKGFTKLKKLQKGGVDYEILHSDNINIICTHQQNRCPLAHSTLIPALLETSPPIPWLLLATILGGRCTTPSHST